jgi:hypothetical protein
LQFYPLAWSIALLLFLVVGLNPWEERGMGRGVLKVMEGEDVIYSVAAEVASGDEITQYGWRNSLGD